MRILLVLLSLCLLVSGCGYRVADSARELPQGVARLYVETVKNRTLEPFVEDLMTNALVKEFGRRQGVQVVSGPSLAQAVFKSRIIAYSNGVVAYNPKDEEAEYRVTIHIEAELRRLVDGKLLWRGGASEEEEYLANTDKLLQEDAENRTQAIVCDRLAEKLYVRLAEDF